MLTVRKGMCRTTSGVPAARLGMAAAGLLALSIAAATAARPAFAQQAAPPSAAPSDTFAFDMAVQDLNTALLTFADRTGLQLIYDVGLVAGRRSAPLKGDFSAREGLLRLLAGTGIAHRFGDDKTVSLYRATADADDGPMRTGPVLVEAAREALPGDRPFMTPGSSAYISSEQIQRVQPSSPGDIFREVPGVLSGSNHNGPAIDINIRGVQGHNRVKVMVEGTQQESSSYRGYAGPDNRTYIDPELIGGIEIEKGPGRGVYGAGTTAGVVNVRLLDADGLVRDGQRVGARLRGGLGGNTVEPNLLERQIYWPRDADTGLREESDGILSEESWFGSFAGAFKGERFEFVGAYAKRKDGNYFSGEHGQRSYAWTLDDFSHPPEPGKQKTSIVQYAPRAEPGMEVPNTSKESKSVLLKAIGRLDGGHSLELGVLDHESIFGQVWPSLVRLYTPQQYALMEANSRRYWGQYRWEADHDLLDLRANAWTAYSDEGGRTGRNGLQSDSWGVEAWNSSHLDTPVGALGLSYGGSYTSSSLDVGGTADGTRRVAGGFVDAALAPTDWLRLDAGLRYDSFDSDGYSMARVCDWSQTPPCEFVSNPGALKDSDVSPRVAATVEPLEGLQLFAQYAEGFRPPSIVETSGAGPSGNFVYNPELKPERLKSLEVGVNVLRDGLLARQDAFRAKLAYFDNRHEDYVVRAGVPGGGRALQFSNIPEAKFEGFEISASYDVGFLFASVGFNYFTDVAYCYDRTNMVVTDVIGTYRWTPEILPGCHDVTVSSDWQNTYVPPKYSGTATVGTRLLDDALVLGARVNVHDEAALPLPQQGGLNFQVRWAREHIFDLFGSYTFNDYVAAGFSIENLTDRFYVSPLAVAQIASPGRTARVYLTLRY